MSFHRSSLHPFDLNYPLCTFSPHDEWQVKDACEGVQIFGATGSGKSSGSGRLLAKTFLSAGFGGLVLTVKPDERQLWEQYCRETGRLESLIVISPSNSYRFNFLDYEFRRPGVGARLTENLVTLFYNVIEIADRKTGSNQGEAYWRLAGKQLLRNAIDLLAVSKERLTLLDILKIINSAPRSFEQLQSEDWRQASFCYGCIKEADGKEKSQSRKDDFELTVNYWLEEFPSLADRTRSSIVSTFTSMADCFLRGVVRDLFCRDTNIVPELTQEGAIILLDLPVKEYGEIGQFAQVLFKFIWQKSIERRDVGKNPRPVFLWVDESQHFVTSYDMMFQTTARSARACSVYLTQNLPNYYAVMGGEQRGKSEADSLLGNLQTKIFHANGDAVTNLWAAEQIGKVWQYRMNFGTSQQNAPMLPTQGAPQGNQSTTTAGGSQVMDYEVLPREFTTLKKGGAENRLQVEGIVFQGGRMWQQSRKNHLRLVFRQDA